MQLIAAQKNTDAFPRNIIGCGRESSIQTITARINRDSGLIISATWTNENIKVPNVGQ